MVGGKYEGKLSADGNSITGTWSQGSPLPLNFTKATPATAWAIPEPPAKIPPMASNATMQDFAGLLQSAVLDRPVVDQTGLTGRWNFTLNWTSDESQFTCLGIKVPPPSDKPDAPPGLF